jgi:hypothetical protein
MYSRFSICLRNQITGHENHQLGQGVRAVIRVVLRIHSLITVEPQFYVFPHSHGNISFLPNEKKQGIIIIIIIINSCLHKGRFLYSCVLLRFGNTFRLMPSSVPPSGECTRRTKTSFMKTSLTNVNLWSFQISPFMPSSAPPSREHTHHMGTSSLTT